MFVPGLCLEQRKNDNYFKLISYMKYLSLIVFMEGHYTRIKERMITTLNIKKYLTLIVFVEGYYTRSKERMINTLDMCKSTLIVFVEGLYSEQRE